MTLLSWLRLQSAVYHSLRLPLSDPVSSPCSLTGFTHQAPLAENPPALPFPSQHPLPRGHRVTPVPSQCALITEAAWALDNGCNSVSLSSPTGKLETTQHMVVPKIQLKTVTPVRAPDLLYTPDRIIRCDFSHATPLKANNF